MSKCPFPHHEVRADLPPLTERIAALPVDPRGYPIPFFVHRGDDGVVDFRVVGARAFSTCHNERRCWVCGQPLGRFVTFVIGPMCTINRTTSEPPNHQECAEWSTLGCPFLTKPNMVRREGGLADESKKNVAGKMIERNPGVTCLWTTEVSKLRPRGYELFRDPQGRPLIDIGNPTAVTWWREGRVANRDEVLSSINSGIPLLEAACDLEALVELREKARAQLHDQVRDALAYVPEKTTSSIIAG